MMSNWTIYHWLFAIVIGGVTVYFFAMAILIITALRGPFGKIFDDENSYKKDENI